MIKPIGFRFLMLTILLHATFYGHVSAQVRIAVAANAQSVIKKLQADFKKKTGIETESIIGASGKLNVQIRNGAPFDVFLSADTEFPDQLYAEGFGLQKPKVYALGSLIICGYSKSGLKNWQSLIKNEGQKKIAIANPKTAPYGKAAEETLKFYKLKDELDPKLVYAENIAQVNTYIQTGAVGFGFTTEAFLYENSDKSELKWARINSKSYGEIKQGAILLSYAKKGNLNEANKFFEYLSSPSARKIISGNGYHLPISNKK